MSRAIGTRYIEEVNSKSRAHLQTNTVNAVLYTIADNLRHLTYAYITNIEWTDLSSMHMERASYHDGSWVDVKAHVLLCFPSALP